MQLQDAFWNARHNPSTPIALWIGHVRVAANDLLSINELPTDQQITDRLVGGLNVSWSAVRDSIVYTAAEMSLDDSIGALEAHEVSLNGQASSDPILASIANAKKFACSYCGKRGHKSSNCFKSKNKGKSRAGSAQVVTLGGYSSFDNEDKEGVTYE